MQWHDAVSMIREIVHDAARIAKANIPASLLNGMTVNYACIFCHSRDELEELDDLFEGNGSIVLETATGRVFLVDVIDTDYGRVSLVKIRIPDETRKERGDADFTLRNWDALMEFSRCREGLRVIDRKDFRMIELRRKDEGWDVIAYFSRPRLVGVFGIDV